MRGIELSRLKILEKGAEDVCDFCPVEVKIKVEDIQGVGPVAKRFERYLQCGRTAQTE